MKRFQYKIVNLGMFRAPERMVRAFAYLGEHGWELVSMYDKSSNWFAEMEKGFAIFKREVPEGEEPDGKWASWSYANAVHHESEHGLPEDSPYNDPNWGAW
jgi:hypothetical protein